MQHRYSVRLIKDIEQRYEANMFDRTNLAFIIDGNSIVGDGKIAGRV